MVDSNFTDLAINGKMFTTDVTVFRQQHWYSMIYLRPYGLRLDDLSTAPLPYIFCRYGYLHPLRLDLRVSPRRQHTRSTRRILSFLALEQQSSFEVIGTLASVANNLSSVGHRRAY